MEQVPLVVPCQVLGSHLVGLWGLRPWWAVRGCHLVEVRLVERHQEAASGCQEVRQLVEACPWRAVHQAALGVHRQVVGRRLGDVFVLVGWAVTGTYPLVVVQGQPSPVGAAWWGASSWVQLRRGLRIFEVPCMHVH